MIPKQTGGPMKQYSYYVSLFMFAAMALGVFTFGLP
jgi:hypothetical protein